MNEKRKLKRHIYGVFGMLLIGIISLMSISQIITNANKSIDSTKSLARISAVLGAQQIQNWLDDKVIFVEILAEELEVHGQYQDFEELKKLLAKQAAAHPDFMTINYSSKNDELIGSSGWVPPADFVATEREWYTGAEAVEGNYITQPYIDAETGQKVISVSRKVMVNNQVEGVVAIDINLTDMVALVSAFQNDQGGYTMLIDSDANIVFHPDEAYQPTADKVVNVKDLARYDKVMGENKGKHEIIKLENGKYGYTQMMDIGKSGMSLIINNPISSILTALGVDVVQAIMIVIVALLISNWVIHRFVDKYIAPMDNVVDVLNAFAEANFHYNMQETDINSYELDKLVQGVTASAATIQGYIGEIAEILHQISTGNLDIEIHEEYIGDFHPIKEALVEILETLNSTLLEINHSSEEVATSAEVISEGATSLAQGATEQLETITDFIHSTEVIVGNISNTIDKVNRTSEITQEAKASADKGIVVMGEMLTSMDRINHTTQKVGEVLKTIDGIAKQTNLLALNAAIESARAGEAGKGFSVLANEIRDLATRSSETVKEIEVMLTASAESVETGQRMANNTAEMLKEVAGTVEKTTAITIELLENSKQQKEGVEELAKGSSHLIGVAEINSSVAEESAAISEQVAAQAERLKGLIAYFVVKE